jgi:nitrous oxidase accessory protein NosD
MSSGTISHATMHAVGEVQSAIGDAIVIDHASPHIVDSTVDNGSHGADLVQVNGTDSAPIFERMEVSNSHCCFHFNTSTNATIKTSYVHDCTYGLMIIFGIDSLLTGNNFERNAFALGLCLGGTATFRGNYVDGPFAESECSDLRNDSPALSPIPGVGPGP